MSHPFSPSLTLSLTENSLSLPFFKKIIA
jgi:hypothetical protein